MLRMSAERRQSEYEEGLFGCSPHRLRDSVVEIVV
jgi:hypothetical protein